MTAESVHSRAQVNIICVDRSTELAERIRRLLGEAGVAITNEADLDRVLERFESESYDALIVTGAAVEAGRADGIELLEVVSAKSPSTQILFICRPRDIRTAMLALRAGTYHYAKLPMTDEELRMLIETAIARRPRHAANLLLKEGRRRAAFSMMVGRSEAMQEVYRQIRQAAATDIPVLILGETGTGKDLVAQAIHQQSERSVGPYMPVHLGALPPELVASELFGHERGAFTGAVARRVGTFEQAAGGTVFLDEIATVDEKVQVSLLRLLEQKRFSRIGGRRMITTDVRVIAASNEDPAEAVRVGRFREDLLFRLDVFRIVMPPLRARRGDIPILIEAFLKQYSREFNKRMVGVSPEFVGLLESHDWPGNVRELKNVIQRAVLVGTGEVLRPEHLPPRLQGERQPRSRVSFKVGTPLAEVEREMILRTLQAAGNNRKRTAEMLGISRRALYNKLKRYDLR